MVAMMSVGLGLGLVEEMPEGQTDKQTNQPRARQAELSCLCARDGDTQRDGPFELGDLMPNGYPIGFWRSGCSRAVAGLMDLEPGVARRCG